MSECWSCDEQEALLSPGEASTEGDGQVGLKVMSTVGLCSPAVRVAKVLLNFTKQLYFIKTEHDEKQPKEKSVVERRCGVQLESQWSFSFQTHQTNRDVRAAFSLSDEV